MNPLQRRQIAKMAYRDIMEVINKWTKDDGINGICISFHWDGCITVDDELFHERQLRDYEE